ncbi:MAG: DUF5615 family PIN-like protein [Dehalococcoidia bacterium]|nr:DUF5615 family PIN-like protein [Dehalococcoidia bacterium]
MKFFADQDVYQVTINFIRDSGHDVLCAAEAGLSRASDVMLLHYTRQEGRILVTRDKDFGALVFLEVVEHSGVILLRATFDTLEDTHQELLRLLSAHQVKELSACFVTVEPGRHRIRRARG